MRRSHTPDEASIEGRFYVAVMPLGYKGKSLEEENTIRELIISDETDSFQHSAAWMQLFYVVTWCDAHCNSIGLETCKNHYSDNACACNCFILPTLTGGKRLPL